MIDNICDNISAAKDDAIKAEEDIFVSKKNMIQARKKKMCYINNNFGRIIFFFWRNIV